MKKIIMRSGISPTDNFDAAYMLSNNSIGGNVGNLIYAYSVYRALTTEETEVVPDYYVRANADPDEINEKYDAYVIPLADAFRQEFIPAIREYTRLIKQLKIPVVVIGVGLRAPFEPKLNESFPFDDDVREFVKAVLEKSSMVGVRGQITADYLTKLGFVEGVDHTVIGCPSMYTFGGELTIRDVNIDEDSRVSVNSSLLSPQNVLNFISRSMREFPNSYFIPQWRTEMELTYLGYPSLSRKNMDYPTDMSHPVYKENRVRYFLSAPSWIDFMSKIDFSFGARLHGNITATIAGTPSLIIPKDARMRELAEYHNLTSLWYNDIDDTTDIMKVIEKADFKAPEKVQRRNFDNFISFLEKNNLEHIYTNGKTPAIVPLDEKLKEVDLLPPISPITGISVDQLVERMERYYSLMDEKQKEKLNRIENQAINRTQVKYQKEINKMKNKIKYLERTLERKSVRYTLGLADKITSLKNRNT